MKLPSKEKILENPKIKKYAHHLTKRCLWARDSKSMPMGALIGAFSSLLPMPFQMFLATPLCIIFCGNLPLAITLVWVSNPITMPFIMYAQYLLGAWILDEKVDENIDIMDHISNAITPLLVGSAITAVLIGLLAYVIAKIIYRNK